VKFCPVLEENKKMDAQRARDRDRAIPQQQQQQPAPAQRPRNAFAVLAEEQEDEERQANQEAQEQELQAKRELQAKQDFPALMGNTRVTQNTNAKSYSCVAATPADEKQLNTSRQQRAQKAQKKAVSWVDEEDDDYDEHQEVTESINLEEMYGDRMYEILLEYFKNDNVSKRHPERICMVVGKLLERDIEELEEFMKYRNILEDAADEIFAILHNQLDPPIPGVIHNVFREDADVNDW
jgi:hypothetical protein